MKTEWEKLVALMAAPPEDDAGAIIVDYYAIRSAWPRIQAAIQAARVVNAGYVAGLEPYPTDLSTLEDALAALDGDGT